MTWVWYAIASGVLFASVNHLDKYLLSRIIKGAGIGSLVIFSSMVGLVVALSVRAFGVDVYGLQVSSALLLVANGAGYVLSLLFYFKALDNGDVSAVVPLFQTVPIFTLLLGWVFLGEVIGSQEIVGGILIMIGAMLLSVENPFVKIHFAKKPFQLMMVASVLTAVNGLLFKAVEAPSFWVRVYWEYLGLAIIGAVFLLFVPVYRKTFMRVIRKNGIGVLGLNGVNELLAIGGKLSIHYASLLTPLALAFWVGEGAQPFFVVVIGLAIQRLFPRLATEKVGLPVALWRIGCIAFMVVGAYVLV